MNLDKVSVDFKSQGFSTNKYVEDDETQIDFETNVEIVNDIDKIIEVSNKGKRNGFLKKSGGTKIRTKRMSELDKSKEAGRVGFYRRMDKFFSNHHFYSI